MHSGGLTAAAEYLACKSMTGAFIHPDISLAEDLYFGRSLLTTMSVRC
jgi:hypothetical protein